MKRIIRLFGRSSKSEGQDNSSSTNQNEENQQTSPFPLENPEVIVNTKMSEIRNVLKNSEPNPKKTGELLQIIDLLINMNALNIFYKKDKKLFKKIVTFLEKEADNETNSEYLNVRMTLVTLKYIIGEKRAFHRFLKQLERNERYHNEASILRLALEQGWTPNQGRIIIDCIVKCENCGKERKIERMVSPTQIREFYLNPCESCKGTEYRLVHIEGQSILRWKQKNHDNANR